MGYSFPLASMPGISGSSDTGGVALLQQLSDGTRYVCGAAFWCVLREERHFTATVITWGASEQPVYVLL